MTIISQRADAKKRQNRRQIAWTFSIITIIVLAMTWYDLNVRDYSFVHRTITQDSYVVTEQDVTRLSDDYSGLTIWQGRLEAAEDGTVTSSEETLPPRAFAQRQVDVIIEIPRLPAAAVEAKLLDAIADKIKSWAAYNNLVAEVILDVREMQAPPRALMGFSERLRTKLDLGYRITLLIDPANPADVVMGSDKEAQSDLLSAIGGIYFYLPAENAAHAFQQAETLGFPYKVIIPPGGSVDKAPPDVHGAYKYFGKFIYPPTLAATHKDAAP